jgi:hypothetical protein
MPHYSLAVLAVTASLATWAPASSTPRTVSQSRQAPACTTSKAPTEDIAAQLAKFRQVEMPFTTTGLSPREVKMVRKLVEAGQYLESVYWRQSDPSGLALYKSLAVCTDKREKDIRHFLLINGSSYDLLEGNKPFLAGVQEAPGRALYPAGITRKEIDDYVAAHPDKRAEIFDPYTVVKRRGKDLVGVPYHVEYRQWLVPAARALREAAALSDDKAFANFLRLRADAFLTDDYYKSDLAWVDLEDRKFDVIMAPYETYLDGMLGVKTSYGVAVMIRNAGESEKLATYKKHVAEIQEALPLAPEDKPSNAGHPTPMEVMDTPYRSGDLRHGYQAVADNLPNDPRIHAEKGTKKIFFKNFMDARVNNVVLPIGRLLMREDQAKRATMDGYLAVVVMHEISHGLGPAYARVNGKKTDIRESVGQIYGGLEEAKADVVGLYALNLLMQKGVLPASRAEDFYASHVAGIFRTVRFGVAEAHARAEMMQFNYFVEQGAITRDAATGRYALDVAKMPVAVASLAKELLEIEATGDRARAEAWFAKYGMMPDDLKAALAKTGSVPVDVDPVTAFGEEVR